jgi:hypothetical protein
LPCPLKPRFINHFSYENRKKDSLYCEWWKKILIKKTTGFVGRYYYEQNPEPNIISMDLFYFIQSLCACDVVYDPRNTYGLQASYGDYAIGIDKERKMR